MWFVTLADPAYPEQAVAYVIKDDNSGGHPLPSELVADTIEELRKMLPARLTRHDMSTYDQAKTMEVETGGKKYCRNLSRNSVRLARARGSKRQPRYGP